MAITAAMIKDLRERTGAGMMDCKKVLVECDGDIELAIETLRKKGAAAAEKKAGRIAAEGIIVSASNDTASVLVEINCETDFVAKDNSFQNFSTTIANTILNKSPENVDALAIATVDNGDTVETSRQQLISKIGENISIRRFSRVESDGAMVSGYLHGARIGVLVKLIDGNDNLGRDIAMHIAASRPLCISESDMISNVLEKEREIYMAQAVDSGKPAEIIDKMVDGRMNKFLKENTLLGQPFVKNPDQTIKQLLDEAGAMVTEMARFEVGEGLEKRNEDFVAEVIAQAGS